MLAPDTGIIWVFYRLSKHQPTANVDALSRLPLPDTPLETPLSGELVLMVERLQTATVSATQIAQWTRRDPCLSQVLQHIRTGWLERPDNDLRPFWVRRLELSAHNGWVLLGDRMVVPPPCRPRIGFGRPAWWTLRGLKNEGSGSKPGMVARHGLQNWTDGQTVSWVPAGTSLSTDCPITSFVLAHLNETEGKIAFLDVQLENKGTKFHISVFRKKIHMDQYLNFESNYPARVKKGIIQCLRHRAEKVCDSSTKY